MGTPLDETWMRLAIETATRDGADPATSPIGCVIVLDGRLLAAERPRQTYSAAIFRQAPAR